MDESIPVGAKSKKGAMATTLEVPDIKHKARSPAEERWRSAWSPAKVGLWNAQQLTEQKRLTADQLGGSAGYKVRHLSDVVEKDEDRVWFASPQFRFTATDNEEYVVADVVRKKGDNVVPREFLRGGPRADVFFTPHEVTVAIATCGGICPGLNSVIREVVLCLWYTYGVRNIFGVRYGYEGFYNHPWMPLNPDVVSSIHHSGGTILGTSRGGFNEEKIVNSIIEHKANQIFLIGGDGTHRGADTLAQALEKRKLKIAVVGIPKTIDNDIDLIDKSFGFDTAVEEARKAIASAHTEAKSTVNGVGLVVLMGRSSGFIALEATLASGEVNICLIPEVPFTLDGPHGLLKALKARLHARGHCVLVVAEGAGLDLMKPPPGTVAVTDKSGNLKLPDVGTFLKSKIKDYLEKEKVEYAMKFIDPSYMIRSVPANSSDSVYTILLSQNAVYGAMAGFTGVTIALVNSHFCFVPIQSVTKTRKVDPQGNKWQRVLEITGQPDFTD